MMKYFFQMCLLNAALAFCALNVELSVKECAGVGADGYPIKTIVPLAEGAFQDISHFRLTDASGNTVPAQFDILSRRYLSDKSISNIAVTYSPKVTTFTGTGTGLSKYYLKDDGTGNSTNTGLTVTDAGGVITIQTGNALKFTIKKTGFTILDQVWYDPANGGNFSDANLVVKSNSKAGGEFIGRLTGDTQYDADRTDLTAEIEQTGPIEAVVRVEAVTKFTGPSNHTHGWAVRIYAYAGRSFIKVDYQLQNSAKTKKYTWPLYFNALNLNFNLNLGSTKTVKAGLGNSTPYSAALGNGLCLTQRKDSLTNIYALDGTGDTTNVLATGFRPEGYLTVDDGNKSVTAMVRNFWRTWPNGLRLDTTGKLQIQLWPEWSCQVNAPTKNPVFNATHLYWLQDMQHVYKEVVLNFLPSGQTDKTLSDFAKTVEFHPVATLPLSYIAQAKASVDMGGIIPFTLKKSTTDSRTPTKALGSSLLGWHYFMLNDARDRQAVSNVGGIPLGAGQYWPSENPSDWYMTEWTMIGELNVRPQWMAQYNRARDWDFLQLHVNSINTSIGPTECFADHLNWRNQQMGGDTWDSAFIDGTIEPNARSNGSVCALDDMHSWLYILEDAYWMTGNPWLKDWYKFVGELRKYFMSVDKPEQKTNARGTGHPWAQAIQSYKVTGDTSIIRMILSTFNNNHKIWLRPEYGDWNEFCCGQFGLQAYEMGYFCRPLINILHEVGESAPQTRADIFQFLSAICEWNMKYANYGTTWAPRINTDPASADAFADIASWYYWYTGRSDIKTHMLWYLKAEGSPYSWTNTFFWSGDFEGRWINMVRDNRKTDSIGPTAISDLRLTRSGNNATLSWTAPTDAKRYHVVYGNKPLSPIMTDDTHFLNWWAGKPIGPNFKATPGAKETLTFTVPDSGYPLLFAAVYSWDSSENISAISNIGLQDTTPASAPVALQGVAVDAQTIRLTWTTSSDAQSGIWRYIIYRDGVKIGETDSLTFTSTGLLEATEYSFSVKALSGSNVEGIAATVTATTPTDIVRPFLVRAYSVNKGSTITMDFSEAINKSTAELTANYAVNNGRTVKSASLLPNLQTVVLTCDTLDIGATYAVTLNAIQDLARTPNLILPNTQINVVHREPFAIDSITRPYDWDTCKTGKTPFVDWSNPLISIPAKYQGFPMIRTSNADKNLQVSATKAFITFISNKALKIYIALDNRQTKTPAWLTSDFAPTGDTLTMLQPSNGQTFPAAIYASKAPVPSGKVTLYGLAGSVAYVNYFAILEPLDSSWVTGGSPVVKVEFPLDEELPEGIYACPNPFNPTVQIKVQERVQSLGNWKRSYLRIFNIQGRCVAELWPNSIESRSNGIRRLSYEWNGGSMASGFYLAAGKFGNKTWRCGLTLAK